MKWLFLFILISTLSEIKGQPALRWPGGKKAAIVLTYDDALNSQLDIAIPQLDSFHLKGTFFLIGNRQPPELERWTRVAAKGHELGNHTLYHPCFSIQSPPDYACYDIARIVREVNMTNSLLYLMDHKRIHSYAYPCTETAIRGVDYSDSLKFTHTVNYARIGGDSNTVVRNFTDLNPLLVPSYAAASNPDGPALVRYVERVVLQGGLGIVMFHGIGGDYISVSATAHRELAQYLLRHRNEIWVATFSEVMDYITHYQQFLKKGSHGS